MIGIVFYMTWLAHYDTLTKEEVLSDDIPLSFDGYTIFFIADIHRRTVKATTLKRVSHPVHAVYIGGDFVERGVSFELMRQNIQALQRWEAPIYFVWGNNDYEVNIKEMTDILLEENVVILKDSVHKIIRGTDHFNLIGLAYYYDNHLQPLVDWQLVDQAFTILLAHKPSAFQFLSQALKEKVNLVLSGHTHGGQIRFLNLGFYEKGGFQKVGKTDVFVTEGYGYTFLPFRLGTHSQCHLITLKHKK